LGELRGAATMTPAQRADLMKRAGGRSTRRTRSISTPPWRGSAAGGNADEEIGKLANIFGEHNKEVKANPIEKNPLWKAGEAIEKAGD
jgi:hypothetical protein